MVLLGILVMVAVVFVGYRLIKQPTLPLPKVQTGPVPTGIVAGSVKEFVNKGSTSVCQVPDGKGEVYIAMLKGKKVRVGNFLTKNGARTEVLIKDGKVWAWRDGSSKGVVAKAEGKGIDQEVYEALDKHKNLCLSGDAADFVFDLPKEVVFK